MVEVRKSAPYLAPTKEYPLGLYSIWYEDVCPKCEPEKMLQDALEQPTYQSISLEKPE